MFTVFLTIAISIGVVMFATLMTLGSEVGISIISRKTHKIVCIVAMVVCTLVGVYSATTYPNLEEQSVYVDYGTVEDIRIIGGVSRYTDIKITTDKYTTTVRAGQFPNVYSGAQIGMKYKVSGGKHQTYNCIDGTCYSTSLCEWNMGCWKETIARFKD